MMNHRPLKQRTGVLSLLMAIPFCGVFPEAVAAPAEVAVAARPASDPAGPAAMAIAPWVSDQGDGSYRNPVLYADYSDPDAVRVGDDYWMTSSSFNHVPGLPILHSRDLVNWTLVNHALRVQVPADHFSRPRHGEGAWAPAIRHHGGRFWIFYPDPDFGIYVITATDPRGVWSEPRLLMAGRGLIDPCPFWDEDGRAWLVHGWARSRAGFANRITLREMSPDGTRLLDDAGVVVIDGDKLAGWRTLEGPKLYKRDGWYYIFAPAGGVAEGYQAVFRARDIRGPYENRIVLEQGATAVNGPHQGAWVDTPGGQHWFLHFQEQPAYGRVVHLQPMRWREDGWPVMGADADGDGKGEPVPGFAKPATPAQRVAAPPTSDRFDGGVFGLQWQWQGNPRASWAERSGGANPVLRLRAVPAPDDDSLWMATNLLMQKFPAPAFRAEVTLDAFAPELAGERAGLIVFGHDYAWIGLRRGEGGATELVQASCLRAQKGGVETVLARLPWTGGKVVLRVDVGAGARCRFSYREEGAEDFVPLPTEFQASSSRWVGAKVGLFAAGVADAVRTGHADFARFEMTGAPVADGGRVAP